MSMNNAPTSGGFDRWTRDEELFQLCRLNQRCPAHHFRYAGIPFVQWKSVELTAQSGRTVRTRANASL
jgi:hypothetical protein